MSWAPHIDGLGIFIQLLEPIVQSSADIKEIMFKETGIQIRVVMHQDYLWYGCSSVRCNTDCCVQLSSLKKALKAYRVSQKTCSPFELLL